MKPKTVIKNLLKQSGIEVTKYPGSILKKRLNLFNAQGIDLVFDVGANMGQYASLMRRVGYTGRMYSFEPLGQAYAELVKLSDEDPTWEAVNIAVGDYDGEVEINISGGSATSSSILDMMPQHVDTKPESIYVGKEHVPIYKLDSIFWDYYTEGSKLMLKIDTQGFEKNVLEGARNVMDYVHGVQLEMSLVELYKGEMLYREMIDFLAEWGFSLHFVEPGFTEKTSGRLLQMDGIFFRD